ncbi:insulin-like receptor isoform X2 [Anthonomus grandis grandis]|uniref:insulin-like receptor isoform X2 n=1 Tax=Anthonomus grandis grandis TaxID=2921223 RepID=UPI0021665E52|nr:insulin-like receptor isoform X2 [Anthonomus grandis grandis]
MTSFLPAMRLALKWGYAPPFLTLCVCIFFFLPIFSGANAHAELWRPMRERGICKSMDIRNSLENFKDLEGCQVIEGNLQILLFDNVNETQLAMISFPELIEITDYLLLFRVSGLRSVGQLFPNLAVIRGQQLFSTGKALVIYEMPSLQEIGLYSLTKIMRGMVLVDSNPSLCFVHSIDWSKIVTIDESDTSQQTAYLKSFKPENECPVCPASVNGIPCPRSEKNNNRFLCWNTEHCQKVCPGCGKNACNADGQCCDEHCVGGCDKNITKCLACKDYVLNTQDGDSCVQNCPRSPNILTFLERRCVTHSECIKMVRPIDFEDIDPDTSAPVEYPYKEHNGSCVLYCPPNYSGNYTEHSCKKCNETCRKECPGGKIDSINLAAELRGCTHITGSIEIQIRGGHEVVRVLEENLGMIEEIDDYLKVVRSFSLVSLNFLKNLKRIKGKKLESNSYSLIVLDNQNLQELFDWNTHKTFKIDNGKLFFHFNPKLCIEKIEELRLKANLPPYKEMEVASNSNGDKVACNVEILKVNITQITSKSARLEWKPFELDDARKLLSYMVYSIEAPQRNVSFYDGRDACGQDNWHVEDVANNIDVDPVVLVLKNLKPFTQYAFFVKTYTIATEKNGAQSEITYFKTKSSTPSHPSSIHVSKVLSNSFVISWTPPTAKNGIISYYFVTGEKSETNDRPDRNYCINTIIPESTKRPVTEKPKTPILKCEDKKFTKKDMQEEEGRIEFEDALHNKVYVRRLDNGSQKNRIRREITRLVDNTTMNSSLTFYTTTVPNYLNGEDTGLNSFRKMVEENKTEADGKTWHSFAFFVKVPSQSIEVKNLRHFTQYKVQVRACSEIDDGDVPYTACSEPNEATPQTLEKKGADNIYNVSILNTTSDSVTVHWLQPPDPNRLIVSVTIWYRKEGSQNSKYIGECISYKDFKNYTKDNKNMVYTIPNLFSGNYSLYLKASSLYGVGEPSPTLVFDIPESGQNIVLVICLSLFMVFTSIIGCSWVFYRKIMRERYLMRLIPAVNPDYLPSVYVVDEWEVPNKNVELIKELGQGSFGMVWEGFAHDLKDMPGVVKCAIKTANEHSTSRERIDFLNEASVMKAFNTTHVVKLLGVVSQHQPALVIMELMVNGDLKTYLRKHRPEDVGDRAPTLKQILRMAVEIADGMAYLEGKKFVHRDLAARNCMVAEDLTVKIGDFGMTRDIYETDYYRKGSRGLLPVRWMSPESLKDGVFSSSSDAWSYGVVLWEMATLASQPYQGLSNEQVLRYIMEGGLMERPENCPDKLYEVMRLCWDLKPNRRPTFMMLVELLLPELLNDSYEHFCTVSFYHSEEGAETRAIRAAAAAQLSAMGDAAEADDVDASTPLNALPSGMRIPNTYAMSASDGSEGVQSVRLYPNPRFFSISEDRPTVNGYVNNTRTLMKNGKAQSQR